jgi:hypothetical protein
MTTADGNTPLTHASTLIATLPAITPALSTDSLKMPNQIWDSLCAVEITPRIPGDPAEYVFTIDLLTDAIKTGLGTSTPNEVVIFWPYQYYGAYIPNVMCQSSNSPVYCSFSDEGVLNVRFTNAYRY